MDIPIEFGYFFAVFVGVTMGVFGSGGSILSVPIMVYIMGVHPVLATGYSLFTVGITAFVGGIKKITSKEFDIKAAFLFGLPSLISAFFTRIYILPKLPQQILLFNDFSVSKGAFLMLVFACFMFFSAFRMITHKEANTSKNMLELNKKALIILPVLGIIIGILAGLVGAGGGFMIIPALVILMNMEMKKAVGTSLIIIASQSLNGFLGEISTSVEIDWKLLLLFTSSSVIGMVIGNKLSEKVDASKLKKGFGWFILSMSLYVLSKEIL